MRLDWTKIAICAAAFAAVSASAAPVVAAAPEEALAAGRVLSRLSLFENYVGVFVAAFMVTVVSTPLVRRVAIASGIIDRPSDPRKVHKIPIAYLGGVAVFLGIMSGILYSYIGRIAGVDWPMRYHATAHLSGDGEPWVVPISVLFGITLITVVGLLDDVMDISPTLKIAGQLFAAAALAFEDVGTRLAKGVIWPVVQGLDIPTIKLIDHLGNPVETIGFNIPSPIGELPIDMIYWIGTGLIAICVLGACNASNLIDGLDGLLSGTTAICTAGLLIIALGLAVVDDGRRDAQRIILCLSLLGACLGFLPHNFNPANIFLGDCGSLLLGYVTIVIILTLGDTGKTYLVLSGLIIYGIPITDTALAIIRRKMAGRRMSDPDSDHLHHMLKRAFGVKGAVLTLYAIGIGFAALGVAISESNARIVYAATLIFASYIGVYAIKIARRAQIESQVMQRVGGAAHAAAAAPANPALNGSARAGSSGTPDASVDEGRPPAGPGPSGRRGLPPPRRRGRPLGRSRQTPDRDT